MFYIYLTLFCNYSGFSFLFGLTQVVDQPTHLHCDNTYSLIDLVFVSHPSSLSFCKVIPPLSNSDHLGIMLEILHLVSLVTLIALSGNMLRVRACELICTCD